MKIKSLLSYCLFASLGWTPLSHADSQSLIEIGPQGLNIQAGLRGAVENAQIDILLRVSSAGLVVDSQDLYLIGRFKVEAGLNSDLSSLTSWKVEFIPVYQAEGAASVVGDGIGIGFNTLDYVPIEISSDLRLGTRESYQIDAMGVSVEGITLGLDGQLIFGGIALKALGAKLVHYTQGESFAGVNLGDLSLSVSSGLFSVGNTLISINFNGEANAALGGVLGKSGIGFQSEGLIGAALQADFKKWSLTLGTNYRYRGDTLNDNFTRVLELVARASVTL